MSDIKPAYSGELMLLGWSQSHSTGAKVTFLLPDDDALECFRHLTVKKGATAGQRFMAVLVQIGDNDEPITPGTDQPDRKKGLTMSAVMLCKSDDFQRFVAQREGFGFKVAEEREEQASTYIKNYCRIESRKELDTSPTAAHLFAQVMADYRAWLNPSFG